MEQLTKELLEHKYAQLTERSKSHIQQMRLAYLMADEREQTRLNIESWLDSLAAKAIAEKLSIPCPKGYVP